MVNQQEKTINETSLENGMSIKLMISKFYRLSGLIVLSVILSLSSPHFLQFTNLMNVFRQASLLLVLSSGMTLVLLIGGIDLSVGSVATLTSCLVAKMLTTGQPALSIIGGVVLSLAVGALCGLINGVMVAKAKLPPFIATLGMMQVARGLSLLLVGGNIIYGFNKQFRFLGAGVLFGIPMPIVIALMVVIFFWFISRRTNFGRSIYATGANIKAAWLSGINVDRTIIKVFTINGIVAAFTGLLYIARLNAAEPGFGDEIHLQAIAATIIGGTTSTGGKGGVLGTVIGALIMMLITNGMNLHGISSLWQQVFNGTIIILAVLMDLLSKKRNERG